MCFPVILIEHSTILNRNNMRIKGTAASMFIFRIVHLLLFTARFIWQNSSEKKQNQFISNFKKSFAGTDLSSLTLKIYLLWKLVLHLFPICLPCSRVPYSFLLYSLPKTKFSVRIMQGKWGNKRKYNITE